MKSLQLPEYERPEPTATASVNERNGRSAWRQKLVDTERGFTLGIRLDSTLFVHLFAICFVVIGGVVLRIRVTEWAVTCLAITGVLSAELFNQAIKTLTDDTASVCSDRARRIGTAAAFVATLGAVGAVGAIFARRLILMLAP